jgi:hypothetical protein
MRQGVATTLVSSGIDEPVGIAVDSTSVYWADYTGDSIGRAPK